MWVGCGGKVWVGCAEREGGCGADEVLKAPKTAVKSSAGQHSTTFSSTPFSIVTQKGMAVEPDSPRLSKQRNQAKPTVTDQRQSLASEIA